MSKASFNNNKLRTTAFNFLEEQALFYVELTKVVLLRAAELRAANVSPRLGLGEALHVACALAAGADTFVTNDSDLAKVKIQGIKVQTLNQYAKML